jgi:hypothetical protein
VPYIWPPHGEDAEGVPGGKGPTLVQVIHQGGGDRGHVESIYHPRALYANEDRQVLYTKDISFHGAGQGGAVNEGQVGLPKCQSLDEHGAVRPQTTPYLPPLLNNGDELILIHDFSSSCSRDESNGFCLEGGGVGRGGRTLEKGESITP